jgi:hypothetical protein
LDDWINGLLDYSVNMNPLILYSINPHLKGYQSTIAAACKAAVAPAGGLCIMQA